ncbi:hypothetical protein HYDPIDRAFT_119314 [Hydnomerulius pinastri MD-312]|uniref:Uncharacterized protein n=1 Tax=Hydnomerulius pinastri MD-312 TaxID=994086 RepID=A0A0C9V0H4_9AGAM|nr:hypothetical protein HYDPIDRAFT_119314 [Hydnomerulius pinastri MD-312]
MYSNFHRTADGEYDMAWDMDFGDFGAYDYGTGRRYLPVERASVEWILDLRI